MVTSLCYYLSEDNRFRLHIRKNYLLASPTQRENRVWVAGGNSQDYLGGPKQVQAKVGPWGWLEGSPLPRGRSDFYIDDGPGSVWTFRINPPTTSLLPLHLLPFSPSLASLYNSAALTSFLMPQPAKLVSSSNSVFLLLLCPGMLCSLNLTWLATSHHLRLN